MSEYVHVQLPNHRPGSTVKVPRAGLPRFLAANPGAKEITNHTPAVADEVTVETTTDEATNDAATKARKPVENKARSTGDDK